MSFLLQADTPNITRFTLARVDGEIVTAASANHFPIVRVGDGVSVRV